MQFTDEMNWGAADFALAGALVIGAVITLELAVRKSTNIAYRTAVGLALAAVFILIWTNAAVGIIGREDNPANLMYVGVLAVGVVGAILAGFQPQGMARAMFTTALALMVVPVIALAAGSRPTKPLWPLEILALTGFFVALFVGSALLFRRAAREQSSTPARSTS